MKNPTKLLIAGSLIFQTLITIKLLTTKQAVAQRPGNCNEPIECFELALKELQDAKAEIKELEKRLEDRVKKAETKADAAQSTANTAVTKADAAQSTANTAVTKADVVQTTANDAVNKANAAQSTANTAVTKADAAQNTANKIGGLHYSSEGIYVFPTPNGVVHLGGGGTCYYEGNSRKWCH